MERIPFDFTPPSWTPDERGRIESILDTHLSGYVIVDPPEPPGGWVMEVAARDITPSVDDLLSHAGRIVGEDLQLITGQPLGEPPPDEGADMRIVSVARSEKPNAKVLTIVVSLRDGTLLGTS